MNAASGVSRGARQPEGDSGVAAHREHADREIHAPRKPPSSNASSPRRRRSENDRVVLGFALAKALEDQGRYSEAFTVLSAANSIKRRHVQWDAHAVQRAHRRHHEAFARPPASASPPELGREVIFIVSLPRSGSTLTEQILASHPDVEGASELPDLGNVLEEESRRTGLEFPDWVPRATPEDWRRLGEAYLARTARFRRERGRFTDKALSNWRLIGAAMAMLPGARFVNCRRDPVETCLACFRKVFTNGQAFTYDLSDLAAYWRDYDRMMRFWNARYPHAVRDQVYEKLLADPEGRDARAARVLRAVVGSGLPAFLRNAAQRAHDQLGPGARTAAQRHRPRAAVSRAVDAAAPRARRALMRSRRAPGPRFHCSPRRRPAHSLKNAMAIDDTQSIGAFQRGVRIEPAALPPDATRASESPDLPAARAAPRRARRALDRAARVRRCRAHARRKRSMQRPKTPRCCACSRSRSMCASAIRRRSRCCAVR